MPKPILEILDLIEQEPGRNNKIQLLKDNDSVVLRRVLKLTYDPYIQFYIRKIPEYIPSKHGSAPLIKILNTLEKVLADRIKTGHEAIEYLTKQLEVAEDVDAKVIERVISKDLAIGISSKTINKAFPGLVPEFNVSLASPWDDDRLLHYFQQPVFAQDKIDGARSPILINNKKYSIRGRSGKFIEDFDVFQPFVDQVDEVFRNDDIVIDGELRVLDKKGKLLPRKKGNGIVNKAIRGTISEDEAKRFVFYAFDIIDYADFYAGYSDATYAERFNKLQLLFEKISVPNVKIAETHKLVAPSMIDDVFKRILDRGGEGLVVKAGFAPYEGKRTNNQMKLKMVHEMDLRIKAVERGEKGKKFQDVLGALVCEDDYGELNVNVGSGFSAEERELLWADRKTLIGKIVEVKYLEISTDKDGNYSLTSAIFSEIRDDKDLADSVRDFL